jgi:hypothetical protein
LDSFSKQIKKLHAFTDKSTVISHNYFEFLLVSQVNIPNIHLLKYKNLVLKYKNLKKIISHNDLSSENLL